MNTAVSKSDWIKARQELLAQEKAIFRAHDEVKAKRRALPWMAVEKDYTFETNEGQKSLSDLFGDKSQLIVYHFMFSPDWETPCEHCSFWADHFDSLRWHLGQRDAAFTAVSRATLSQINDFKKRMGWQFPWASAGASSFPYDFLASFTAEEVANKSAFFNFADTDPFTTDREGASVFYKNADGQIFLTYATFARGIDMLNGTYNFLDICPKGRNEQDLPFPQAWVKFHDEYDQGD